MVYTLRSRKLQKIDDKPPPSHAQGKTTSQSSKTARTPSKKPREPLKREYNLRSKKLTQKDVAGPSNSQNARKRQVSSQTKPKNEVATKKQKTEKSVMTIKIEPRAHSTPLDVKINMPKSLPNELLVDILRFLSRNEVDKTQLVSYSMRSLIELKKPTDMPFYHIRSAGESDTDYATALVENNLVLKKLTCPSLNTMNFGLQHYSLFKDVVIESAAFLIRNSQEAMCIYANLKAVIASNRQKLVVKHCVVIVGNGVFADWIKNLRQIFNDFIRADILTLNIGNALPELTRLLLADSNLISFNNPIKFEIVHKNLYNSVNLSAQSKLGTRFLVPTNPDNTIRDSFQLPSGSNGDFMVRETLLYLIEDFKNLTKPPSAFRLINFQVRKDQSSMYYEEMFLQHGLAMEQDEWKKVYKTERKDGYKLKIILFTYGGVDDHVTGVKSEILKK